MSSAVQSSVLSPEAGLTGLSLLIIIPSIRSRISRFTIFVISVLISFYLKYRYPIHHVRTGKSIPTCPYSFPNGQGNVAKFLEGLNNSTAWSSRYGSVYRIWSGTKPEVVLTRPEHIRAVFKDSDKHVKAVNSNSGYFMQELLGQCLGLISGREWVNLKNTVQAPFIHSSMATHVQLLEESVSRFIGDLRAKKAQDSDLDPIQDLKMLPFYILARILYGTLTAETEAKLEELARDREKLFRHVIHGGLTRFKFARLLPTKANKELTTFRRKWRAFNDRVVNDGRLAKNQPAIVLMHRDVELQKITMEELLQTMDEMQQMLFANLDVTMSGVGWALVFLSTYPELQKKLRNEIRQWQVNAPLGHDRMHKYLLSTSTLLHASILEAARLKPLAAFSVPQSAPTDRVVGDYVIPLGTDFVIDSHSLNLNSSFWGKDADVYRPERFLERNMTDLRYSYWTFGFGPRQCLGKHIADLMLHALIVHVVDNYDLSNQYPEEKWKKSEEMWMSHPDIKLQWAARS